MSALDMSVESPLWSRTAAPFDPNESVGPELTGAAGGKPAASDSGPQTPSGTSPCALCHAFTLAVVSGP